MGLHRIIKEFKLLINHRVSKKYMNLDGDFEDSREDVVYQFFQEDNKLSRKSGQGYFQILMEPIYSVFFMLTP